MKAYLTKEHNGLYMLTHDKPIITRIRGTRIPAAYVPPGDPFGTRHHCPRTMEMLFGIEPLEPLCPLLVELKGQVCEPTQRRNDPYDHATD